MTKVCVDVAGDEQALFTQPRHRLPRRQRMADSSKNEMRWRGVTRLHSAPSSLTARDLEHVAELDARFPDAATPHLAIPRLSRSAPPVEHRIRVLFAAMPRKISASAMRHIISTFGEFPELKVDVMDEDALLRQDVSEWPPCDCLVAFDSDGFPILKMSQYVAKHRPLCINDIEMQRNMRSRTFVYNRLEEIGLKTPDHIVVDYDNGDEIIEKEDSITFDGKTISKPFVEKPVDADDHDIIVYFAASDGGGAQVLFRKKQDRASSFEPTRNTVRRSGHFIYEKYLPTGGIDIKVYAVGPLYAHAEGRKSPVLDGLVLRNSAGKEVRCPVLLSKEEKNISSRIIKAFKQFVCGFDILRSESQETFVMDVNGWSLAKRAPQYYADVAHLLRHHILDRFQPKLLRYMSFEEPDSDVELDPPNTPTSSGPRLCCVVAVIRHGDRTPKQKMKFKTGNPSLLQLFSLFSKDPQKELKLKARPQLEKTLEIVNSLIAEQPESLSDRDEKFYNNLHVMHHILTEHPFSGINRKIQLKPLKWALDEEEEQEHVVEAQVVLKWGGELTSVGVEHSEKLGHRYRESLYTTSAERTQLVRLHAMAHHDFKIYASDEGRVQLTAAAFAKGLLNLDGDLVPILVSLVRKDTTASSLLDDHSQAQNELDAVKRYLHTSLSCETADCESLSSVCTTRLKGLQDNIKLIGRPHERLGKIHSLIGAILEKLRPHQTRLRAVFARWDKLYEDLTQKAGFNISKIPDIYDSVKYDLIHGVTGVDLPELKELITAVKPLADIVVMQEYGITDKKKLSIGSKLAAQLLMKIEADFRVATGLLDSEPESPVYSSESSFSTDTGEQTVRSRFYFTSESHIHALMNFLMLGSVLDQDSSGRLWPNDVSEFNYLSQIVFRVYERSDREGENRFFVEWLFSPGDKLPPEDGIYPLRPVGKTSLHHLLEVMANSHDHASPGSMRRPSVGQMTPMELFAAGLPVPDAL
eukprot:m.42343 g.42343  ORF g.42343 m.42343 type:complete len:979 (-) comp6090_c0_seq1:161-3097(-)